MANLRSWALLCVLGFALAGCESQVQFDADAIRAMTGVGASDGSDLLEVLTFQNSLKSAWILDGQGRAYTNQRLLKVTGRCLGDTRAVTTFLNGAAAGSVSRCNAHGFFAWESSVPADGEWSAHFVPQLGDGTLSERFPSAVLVVDTIAPAKPVITTNDGLDLVSNDASITLEGTVDAETTSLTETSRNGALSTDISHHDFTHQLTLSKGASATLSFVARDLAGNSSQPAVITVAYSPRLVLSAAQFSGIRLSGALSGVSGLTQLQTGAISPIVAPTQPRASSSGRYRLTQGLPQVASGLDLRE